MISRPVSPKASGKSQRLSGFLPRRNSTPNLNDPDNPRWVPLQIAEPPSLVTASSLRLPAGASHGNTLEGHRVKRPAAKLHFPGTEESLLQAQLFRPFSATGRSSTHSSVFRRASAPEYLGDGSFQKLLQETREASKALHRDPFDTEGPNRIIQVDSREGKPFVLSLNVGDALCGFVRGKKAAFKADGTLVTVRNAGGCQGMLEVQFDSEDVDGVGEVCDVKADDLFMPTVAELRALELRKHKVKDDQASMRRKS